MSGIIILVTYAYVQQGGIKKYLLTTQALDVT